MEGTEQAREQVALASRSVALASRSLQRQAAEIQELRAALCEADAAADTLRVQNRELRDGISTDSLTGIKNRIAANDALPRLVAQAARNVRSNHAERGLAVLMVDVDHFKEVNDTHGHAVGDQVLREVAQALQGRVRESDLVVRWGGEEFLVALVDVEPSQVAVRAEELRGAVEVLKHVPTTVSIGAAIFPGAGSAVQLVDKADAAMYRAKQGGRNRVEVC